MNSKTTIAIVTFKRPAHLERLLVSIQKQTLLPVRVLVVDNEPQQSAKVICQQPQFNTLPITYLTQNGTVPHCRNLALKKTKTTYLGFIDDDCVLDKNWLQAGLGKITTQHWEYVLGKTKLLNPENIVAAAQHARDAYWKKYNDHIFDTKNVIIDLKKINHHQLLFDENCQSSFYDSADFDFDFQVYHSRLAGGNCSKMVVSHQETNRLYRYLKRAYHRGKLAKYLDEKWQQQGRLSGGKDKFFIWWLLHTLKNFTQTYQQYSPFYEIKESTPSIRLILKKLTATIFIRLFDRYYALGYSQKTKIDRAK